MPRLDMRQMVHGFLPQIPEDTMEDWVEDDDAENQITPLSDQEDPREGPSKIEQLVPIAGPSKTEQHLPECPLKMEQHASTENLSSKYVTKVFVGENTQSISDEDLEELTNLAQLQQKLQILTSDLEIVRHQVALERKKRDLIAYEAKNFVAKISARVTLSMIAKLLGNFKGNPEDLPGWSKQLLVLQRTYGLSDSETKILMAMRMQGRAKKWLLWNSEIIEMSTESTLEKLKNMFYYKSSKIVLRKKFENRMWNSNESFYDYFYDKMIMANRIPIDDKQELVDDIIDGIDDIVLKNQARMHCFQTPEALLQAFEQMSLSYGISKENQSETDEDSQQTDSNGHGKNRKRLSK